MDSSAEHNFLWPYASVIVSHPLGVYYRQESTAYSIGVAFKRLLVFGCKCYWIPFIGFQYCVKRRVWVVLIWRDETGCGTFFVGLNWRFWNAMRDLGLLCKSVRQSVVCVLFLTSLATGSSWRCTVTQDLRASRCAACQRCQQFGMLGYS